MGTYKSPGAVRTDANLPAGCCCAFTLSELMVVVGLISVFISLLLPVVSKVRVAANSAKCSSNLHQMGLALTMYLGENNGHLPLYAVRSPANPTATWYGYWLGMLDQAGVRGDSLICPSASESNGAPLSQGYGDAGHCWTGRSSSIGSAVRFSDVLWRDGSYGYNQYLTAGSFEGPVAATAAAVREFSRTPAFLDCVWIDTAPRTGSAESPAAPPPDLTGGQVGPGSPEHWKFLISRHGRGINVCMGDGSASWIPLEETYMLSWRNGWSKYPLTLPPK